MIFIPPIGSKLRNELMPKEIPEELKPVVKELEECQKKIFDYELKMKERLRKEDIEPPEMPELPSKMPEHEGPFFFSNL